jgi:seryl-tRNA synthetase
MYPAGEMEINPNVDLYIRNQMPQTPPVGVSSNTNNIDTVLYQNYVNGGAIGQSYGLANASSAQQQQLQQLQTNLNLLSNQINGLTNQFETGNQQLEQQSQANSQGLNNYIADIKKTNKKIKTFNTNVDNVLQDSDIVVLKQNYDYLFWSILAVTTVIISMNIIKK